MQVVIEIYDYLYNQIVSDAEIMIYTGRGCGKTLLATLLRSIRIGTPLPKGHGDLIDRNKLNRKDINCANFPTNFIDMAEVIIPADKENA